jgi:hypothetical protein
MAKKLNVSAMIGALQPLLISSGFKIKALEISREIAQERGVKLAAAVVENVRLQNLPWKSHPSVRSW